MDFLRVFGIFWKKYLMADENVVRPYIPLYQAALRDDWESAQEIIKRDPHAALTAWITRKRENVLHIAAGTGYNEFLRKFVHLVEDSNLLELRDIHEDTPLLLAAIAGNTEGCEILIQKNHRLPLLENFIDGRHDLPLHAAAEHRHYETVRYLLPLTKNSALLRDAAGAHLVNLLITADFYGAALEVLERHPDLATQEDWHKRTALEMLSEKPQAFQNARQSRFLKRLFCQYSASQRPFMLKVKKLEDLVKRICQEIGKSDSPMPLLKRPILNAGRKGIPEIITAIIQTYPYAIWHTNEANRNIFQLAVLHRQENVYNLMYQMKRQRYFATGHIDKHGNSILHLAARLVPSDKVSGAALQMQRELQWFKEVEKYIQPSLKEKKSRVLDPETGEIDGGKTARALFTEEHKQLVKEGEKWMKNTASSCSVVATLVAAVVFAAAFTVPGGNNSDKGTPIFLHDSSFIVFVVSDAVSLFSSITSVLMFLGILTSRYAEEDFLKSLPMRLCIGLLTLFLSITSMVVAFSASIYSVVVHRPKYIIPIAQLATVPATWFCLLQFPLLAEVFVSTFGPNIFGQKKKEFIY